MECGLCVDGLLERGEELLLEAEDLADVAEERGHLGRVGRQEEGVLLLRQRLQVGLRLGVVISKSCYQGTGEPFSTLLYS